MAAKFKLTLSRLADFKMPVKFTMPNGEEGKIVFTVAHKTGDEVQALYDSGVKDNEFITSIATGWDLEEEFNAENADMLVKLFPSAAIALTTSYISALAGQRVKN